MQTRHATMQSACQNIVSGFSTNVAHDAAEGENRLTKRGLKWCSVYLLSVATKEEEFGSLSEDFRERLPISLLVPLG